MFVLSILFSQSIVHASYDNNQVVDAHKVWKITFNQPINFSKLSKDNIQVKDKNNNVVDTRLAQGPFFETVIVKPPEDGYSLGKEYILTITTQVFSENGKQMKNEINFNFKVKEKAEETVVFKNDRIDLIIRDLLNKAAYYPIYKSELDKITELNIRKSGTNDISGIENLVNLKRLNLEDNEITDISPLKGLVNLESLNLNSNRISDISSIGGLTNLKALYLNNNEIVDISSLKRLNNLQELWLNKNQIENILSLSGLRNLEDLNLNCNKISNVTDIKYLSNLKLLDLRNNQITDVSALGVLTNLHYLQLYNNQIRDLETIQKLLPNCQINNMFDVFQN